LFACSFLAHRNFIGLVAEKYKGAKDILSLSTHNYEVNIKILDSQFYSARQILAYKFNTNKTPKA